MRILRTTALTIVLVGFLIKFFHVHYHTVVILAGLALLLADNLSSIIISARREAVFRELALSFWLIFLLFTLKFFPYYQVPLILAAIFSLLALQRAGKTGIKKGLIPILIIAITSMAAFLVPAPVKYYYTSIKWNYEIDSDYRTWDRYSWHLYRFQNYEEAFQAAETALRIAEEMGDTEWTELIDLHLKAIKERNWESYPGK